MLEDIFAGHAPAPATARGAMYAPAPRRQQSPLDAFMRQQAFGRQQAGNAAPSYQHLAPAGGTTAPGFNPAKGAPANLDPSTIQNFYSDPAHADYHFDPALLGIEAADNATRDNAETEALRGRRSIAVQLGDPGLAGKILPQGDATLGAVSANPDTSTSILARLARSYRDTTASNEDALNKANLFYSSERGRVLNSGAQDYATAQADAIANAQSQLDQLSGQLAGAKGGADTADQQANSDAFNRYMAAIAAAPPSGAPPGGGGGTQPPPSGGGGDPVLAALQAGADQQPTNDFSILPFTSPSTPVPPALPDVQAAFDQSVGNTYPIMPFTGPGTLDANTALADYLSPQKKPLSGYAAGSGSSLH